MRKIYFRADGNASIGLGHMFRCQSLASILHENYECIGITQKNTLAFFSMEKGFQSSILLDEHSSYFGESLFLTENILTENDIIVLDGYHFDTEYQRTLKKTGCKVVCIDDTFDHYMVADAVINHAGGISLSDYKSAVFTKIYLGPGYAILNEAFQQLPDTPKEFEIIDTAFVCFGGADTLSLTEKTLEACLQVNYLNKVNLVVGGGYLHRKSLEKTISTYKGEKEICLHQNLKPAEMSIIMQASQLAIASASSISYELCRVGIGLVVCAYVENQGRIFAFLTSEKMAAPIHEVAAISSKEIGKLLTSLDLKTLNAQVKRQRSFFQDARPALSRIFRKLDQEFGLTMRKAEQRDCKTYFEWANDPVVRENSINIAPIPWENHVKWFTSRLQSPDSFLYICENDGIPVGQVRFDLQDGRYVINYLIGANSRGKGLSESLLRLSIIALCRDLGENISLYAVVKKGNHASSKAFLRNAFHFTEYTTFDGDSTPYEVYVK